MASRRTADKDRFTRRSRTGRSRLPGRIRDNIFNRDNFVCQFCMVKFPVEQLTVDHLIPLAEGGIDEMTNYVTACRSCNEKKGSMSMKEFADCIKIDVVKLPVHGDLVIDNENLPIQFRILRKQIFDKTRAADGRLQRSTEAQRRLEKAFRLEFHETDLGKEVKAKYPDLPGPVRVMLPQILTIGKNDSEITLLIELAKSAHTRNLIGTEITGRNSVLEELDKVKKQAASDPTLLKRINWAIDRWQKTNRHS